MTLGTDTLNDVQLVEQVRQGDREAFGWIVERYQSLVCALTYSACGDLHASEDLAQVTFITAWCQLPNLQEPAKLKSWLCGIARNVTNNSFRSDKRAPTVHAETLETTSEIATSEPTPRDNVISREEEAILWRSLGELPVTYREPLVLFYRQHQSVTDVADALDLSEDVVRQRLSRGRVMLTEQVAAFVEGALRQTAPGGGFTVGVLAALPKLATSGKVVAAGVAAAKGTTVAKSAASLGAGGGMWGLFGSMYFSLRANVENTKSPRERQFMIGLTWIRLAVTVAVLALGFGLYKPIRAWDPLTQAMIYAGGMFVVTVYGIAMFDYQNRRRRQIQMEDGTWVATDWTTGGKREGLSLDSLAGGSKANASASLAFAIAAIVITARAIYLTATGHWVRGLLDFALCGAVFFWRVRSWQRQPRFDARFRTMAGFVGLCGLIALNLGNLPFLHAGMNGALQWVIAFNAVVVLAYAVLIGVVAWRYRTNVQPQL